MLAPNICLLDPLKVNFLANPSLLPHAFIHSGVYMRILGDLLLFFSLSQPPAIASRDH